MASLGPNVLAGVITEKQQHARRLGRIRWEGRGVEGELPAREEGRMHTLSEK